MSQGADARKEARYFHLFTYGTLRTDGAAAHLLEGCDVVGHASVAGSLYDIDGAYPALVLAGSSRVEGEVWRCPPARLPALDAYERVADGLFRRVAVRVGEWACWTYVAGPKLARRLTPNRRMEVGRW